MTPLGWPGIARLALVQSAIGAMVAMATSLLNRVMVVEYALPAAIPAGLVAWHYAVQLSRPIWGHGSDRGARRTPWIIGGMALLYAGLMCAVAAVAMFGMRGLGGAVLALAGFTLIGAGVGAAGTSLLALLATRVAPARRASAAAITWVMMIFGIVVATAVAGQLLDPFSPQRLAYVVAGVGAAAMLAALIGVWRVEGASFSPAWASPEHQPQAFGAALSEMLDDPDARQFTGFVFLSMLAYSMQDLILEPYAGLFFGYTAGQSTSLSSVQHGGVLLGMILAGVGGSAFGGGGTSQAMRRWIVGGCLGSALAIILLGIAAMVGTGWPLALNVWLLGFANGVFAVAAIGAMMGLAGAAGPNREGMRMGVWGAAQAVAFGLGGLSGAVAVDLLRSLTWVAASSFSFVFVFEGGLFLVAAWLAAGMGRSTMMREVTA